VEPGGEPFESEGFVDQLGLSGNVSLKHIKRRFDSEGLNFLTSGVEVVPGIRGCRSARRGATSLRTTYSLILQ